MFTSILLPTDGSPLSEKIIGKAIAFAQLNQARIVGLSVVQPLPLAPVSEAGMVLDAGMFQEQMGDAAHDHVARIAAAAQAAGVPFEGVVADAATPYEAIVATAEQHGCDIIVMASHGRKGLDRFLLGSETERVLSHTVLPVLVLR